MNWIPAFAGMTGFTVGASHARDCFSLSLAWLAPTLRAGFNSRSKITIGISVILLLTTPFAQAEGLGRLFFTPAQRAQLNSHHYLPTTAVTQPEVLTDDAPETEHSLTVNGIVQRSGGKRTAWINGAAKTVEQGDENPTSVMVNLPDQNKMVRLKVGQRVILTPPANTNAAKPSAEEPAPVSED